MKPTTSSTLQVWGGTGLVVLATIMMKVSSYSVLRTVVFVVVILVATGLIIRSLRHRGADDEE